MAKVICINCGAEYTVRPCHVATTKYCSNRCHGEYQSKYKTGPNHPRWTGGERTKVCGYCGKEYGLRPNKPITTLKKSKFCSKPCADIGGIKHTGPDHYNWKGGIRLRGRDSKHAGWASKVISRDNAECVMCGAIGVELHAHHVESYKDSPSKRHNVSNGITLCAPCHWNLHSAMTANSVNSVELLPGNAEDNTEPSPDRKILEGVTARGRAYRRVDTHCDFCGAFMSRRAGQVKGKPRLYCSCSCARKDSPRVRAMAVISPMSAGAERHDIAWTA